MTSDAIIFDIDPAAVIDGLLPAGGSGETLTIKASELVPDRVPIKVRRRSNEARIVLAGPASLRPDQSLIDLIAKANHLLIKLTDGSNNGIGDIARSSGLDRSDVGRLLPLAFLAPKIVDDILAGRQPAQLTARLLARNEDLPIGWQDQRLRLGF